MEYSSKAIANYFFRKAQQEGQSIDPLKLQKLVYFAHGWNLGLTGKPLISETVEAWKFGPVISDIYHEFKANGRGPVDFPAFGVDSYGLPIPVKEPSAEADPDTVAMLDRIWKIYGPLTGVQLSNLTHEKGTPWYETFFSGEHKGAPPKGTDISEDLIRDYFSKLARPE